MPKPERAIGKGKPLDKMDLLSRIKPEETAIHVMLETTAMTAGETPRIENLCESSSRRLFKAAAVLDDVGKKG